MTKHSQLEDERSAPLCDDEVVFFLKDNPDFFLRQLDLLVHLRIPHPQRGAVSLVEIQLEALREKMADLEEEITSLMSVAAGNGNLFRVFSVVHHALFEADNLKDIHQALDLFGDSLDLTVNLRLYDASSFDVTSCDASPQILDRSAVEAIKGAHFCGQRIYLGRLRKVNGEQFVTSAPELGSYALLPVFLSKEHPSKDLHKSKDLGFLSFASKDGGHFQPSMDTLFVEQLAEHIAILLTKWQTTP